MIANDLFFFPSILFNMWRVGFTISAELRGSLGSYLKRYNHSIDP
jgi:hypothetical protein